MNALFELFAPKKTATAYALSGGGGRVKGAGQAVVYLDFDGVLHHEEVYWTPKKGIFIKEPGQSLFQWEPYLIEALAPYPEMKIVLSTSWVKAKSFDFAKSRLSADLQSRVIGATFHRREHSRYEFDALSRARQILADVQRRKPRNWIAIDDDVADWPENKKTNLVATQGPVGLSDPTTREELALKLASLSLY